MSKEVPPYVDISGVVTEETDDDPTVVHDDSYHIVQDDPPATARFSKLWNFTNRGAGTTQVKIDVHTSDSVSPGLRPGRELYMLVIALLLLVLAVSLGVTMGVLSARQGAVETVPVTTTPTPPPPEAVCDTAACLEVGAYMLASLNESADPCDDFYEYACGGFRARHYIPPGRSESSIRLDLMYRNIDKIEQVIMDPTMRPNSRAYERKLKYFFRTCLDEYGRTKQSASNLLQTIDMKLGGWYGINPSILDGWDFQDALSKAHGDLDLRPFIRWYVYRSAYNPSRNAIRLYYPVQEVYWNNLLRLEKWRTAYRGYIRDVGAQLLLDGDVSKDRPEYQERLDTFVSDVYQLDMKLAQVISTTFRYARFENIRLSAFPNSQVNYQTLFTYTFQTAGVSGTTYVEHLYKNYTLTLDQTFANLGVNKTRMLNNYLVAYFIFKYAKELAPAYRHAYFAFREAAYGYVSRTSIRSDCFTSTRSLMSEAVSAEYVKMFFHPHHKDEIYGMYDNITAATDRRLQNLTWMDAPTRAVARDKVAKMREKLGYPDYMENQDVMDGIYAGLNIQTGIYFMNLMAAALYRKTEANNKLTGSTNEDAWSVAAYQTYSYYYASLNEVRVTAGMMQFPYYWHRAPTAHKYGGIGIQVAEQVHRAFDEYGYGNRYYGNGSYTSKTWYSPASLSKFQSARDCLAAHYSGMKAGPYDVPGRGTGIMVDIKGDKYPRYAISYIGGLRQTYKAYLAQQATSPDPRIPGLDVSNAAAFFISAAQIQCYVRHPYLSWSRANRGSMQEDILLTGALQQMEEFQQVFQCPNDSKMVASKKCVVF